MKAVAIQPGSALSDEGAFADVELPAPTPGPEDLLVEVRAVALNPVDTKVRRNRKGNERLVLGYDAAGVVLAVGAAVTLFKPGDEVYYAGDIHRPGSNQQLQAVDARIVGRKPRSLDFAQAAALPLTAITAWEALFERLGVALEGARGTLLIVAGAGGVGSIAIQLAKHAGLRVIATASRPESAAWVRELGAHEVVDHRKPLRAQLDGEVDAVAIFSETEPYFAQLPELLRAHGKAVAIVETAGPLDLGPLKAKSLSFAWEFMFTRSSHQTPDMIEIHHLLNRVGELVDQGKLRTTVNKVLRPLSAANVREAHALMESGKSIGKVVLSDWP